MGESLMWPVLVVVMATQRASVSEAMSGQVREQGGAGESPRGACAGAARQAKPRRAVQHPRRLSSLSPSLALSLPPSLPPPPPLIAFSPSLSYSVLFSALSLFPPCLPGTLTAISTLSLPAIST